MKPTLCFFIAALLLILSGCSTSRKVAKEERTATAEYAADTSGHTHSETGTQTATATLTENQERQDVTIDFVTVRFNESPGAENDSTARDWLNAVLNRNHTEGKRESKPPNVASVTAGRAVISGEKTGQTITTRQTQTDTTTDTEVKAHTQADTTEAVKSATEEKPKPTFWDCLYLLAGLIVITAGFVVTVKVCDRIRR